MKKGGGGEYRRSWLYVFRDVSTLGYVSGSAEKSWRDWIMLRWRLSRRSRVVVTFLRLRGRVDTASRTMKCGDRLHIGVALTLYVALSWDR